MSTEDRLVSFVRSGPGHVTVTLPRLCGPESLHVAVPQPGRLGETVGTCVQGKGKEEQRWGAHNGVSTCGVTSRVGGKRGDGDRGGPRSVSTVSWWGHRSCSHIYSRVGPKGETDYRDVRWTRSLKGTVELLRGQKAAVHPPGLEEQGEGYPETRGCPPPGTGGQRGDKVFPGDQEVASTPPMPLGICWNLSRWAEQDPLGTAWPCPLPTSDGHSSQDRQKDKHRVESHQMNVQPSGKGGSRPRTAGSPGGAAHQLNHIVKGRTRWGLCPEGQVFSRDRSRQVSTV